MYYLKTNKKKQGSRAQTFQTNTQKTTKLEKYVSKQDKCLQMMIDDGYEQGLPFQSAPLKRNWSM